MPTSSKQLTRVIAQARREGYDEARREVLDTLEAKYMDPSVKRGTPRGDAILELASELSKALQK